MATTAAGIGFLVVLGLAAVGYSDAGWGSTSTTADGKLTTDGGVAEDQQDDGDGLPTCDGVLVIESASGSARVPGDVDVLDGTSSSACEMQTGSGDEDDDAAAVVQQALVQCHGEAVTVDGQYGPQTADAVAAVQRQAGITPDGAYGPATMEAMRWPVDGTGGTPECVTAVADDAVAALPATG